MKFAFKVSSLFLLTGCLMVSFVFSEEPLLPIGLQGNEEPQLPSGLGETFVSLPEIADIQSEPPFDFYGFLDGRIGVRTQKDSNEKAASIGEVRLQLNVEKIMTSSSIKVTTDFLVDPVLNRYSIDLKEGEGFLDLREAQWMLRATEFMDVQIGRQILTWGTGDLLFLNDLFPKDFRSFFIGRDVEYLKAPSDAAKVSLFNPHVNLDLVYTPRFDSDRFVDGRRLSFFNTSLGRLSGRSEQVKVDKPNDWFQDEEWALRLYQTLKGYEWALYGYNGFWKNPAGINPVTAEAVFPSLQVYGGSVRGVVGKGIGNVEFAYYRSKQDEAGTNPFIQNSQYRFLTGYEQEIGHEFTMGLQYYVELISDFSDLKRNLPTGAVRPDKDRHLMTVRLTKLLMNQNLELSLFTFYSPSDQDVYLRPHVQYKFTDDLAGEIGGNLFIAKKESTFFGQFKKNSNLYLGLRYSF